MKRENQPVIESGYANIDDALFRECWCSLGRPDRVFDVWRMVQAIVGTPSFFGLVELEAAAPTGEKAVRGKLRDGVTILDPKFARALLANGDAFPSETESVPSPANRPVAAAAVAGKPDRAVVAQAPAAVMTPSATPIQ